MSKKIFINNLDTFVSKALLNELIKKPTGEEGEDDAGEQPIIYGTYISKDSSEKTLNDGTIVKKMLKVSYRYHCLTTLNSEIETTVDHEVSRFLRPYHPGHAQWRSKRCQTCSAGSVEA